MGCQTSPAPNDSTALRFRPGIVSTAADPRDAHISQLDRERQRLADTLASEQSQRTVLEKALAEAQRAAVPLETQAGRVGELEREVANRDRELSAVQSQLSAAPTGDELTNARQQIAARDQELAGLREQLAGMASAAELGKARQQAAAHAQEIDRLKQQLAGTASAADLAAARRDLSTKERELADLKDRLAGIVTAEELAAAKQRLAEVERQLTERNQELARLIGLLSEEQQATARLRGDLAAHMERLKGAQRGIGKALRKEVQKGTIAVDMRQDHLLVNLTSGLLFESGADQLKPEGADALRAVGSILKDFPEYAVEIGGHTDNVAIKGELAKRFATNKELSTARAQSALQALQEGGMTNRVTTVGYADRHPVASNATADGRARNRRVEVKVMPK